MSIEWLAAYLLLGAFVGFFAGLFGVGGGAILVPVLYEVFRVIGVPTEVLQASGRLTDEQYEAIQQHPVRGREITKDLEFLGEAIEGIHLHHERIDGRGYPLGLKGSEIPEFARIIAVADAFDSMTTTRSYRGARSIEEAIEVLRVFDRWGDKVWSQYNFQPNNPGLGWDAVVRNNKLDPGVFVYWATIKFIDGKSILYKGDVTLVR